MLQRKEVKRTCATHAGNARQNQKVASTPARSTSCISCFWTSTGAVISKLKIWNISPMQGAPGKASAESTKIDRLRPTAKRSERQEENRQSVAHLPGKCGRTEGVTAPDPMLVTIFAGGKPTGLRFRKRYLTWIFHIAACRVPMILFPGSGDPD